MADRHLIAGRYELINKIGEGEAGALYRALDRTTGKEVTIRLLNGDVVVDPRADHESAPPLGGGIDRAASPPDPPLATKLMIPPLRPQRVKRPRLLARLDEGLAAERRLTLVSAPAGFGKTTLLSEWAASQDHPVAWLALDEGDNDPMRFLTYLITALQGIDPALGGVVRDLLGTPQVPTPDLLVPMLINNLAAFPRLFTLVLDDYHVITSSAVHAALNALLQNPLPPLHLVLSTREDPPLPLARLRARGQITELRERDLRFELDEISAFLQQTMRLSLPPRAAQALESRTEGWAAGLQLAALALQEHQTDAEHFIAAFAGSDRYVMDYLIEEVIQHQPEHIRVFLVQTAILDRLTASLCEALTGYPDCQALLEQLETANLFVIPLDHERVWYRYHRLFAEVLRATLQPEDEQHLHGRAAAWYEAHGMIEEAIEHAAAHAEASGDLKAFERLVVRAGEDMLAKGSVQTVGRWLGRLPDKHIRTDAALAIYQGWLLAIGGEADKAEEFAQVAENLLEQGSKQPADARSLLTLRAFLAVMYRQDYEEAIRLGAAALEGGNLPRAHWPAIAMWVLGEAQERTRPIDEAIATLRELSRTAHQLAPKFSGLILDNTLIAALHMHGQRREAVRLCAEALQRHVDSSGRYTPTAGLLLSRLGALHYEANDLDQAWQYHEQGNEISLSVAVGTLQAFTCGTAALTLAAMGDPERALRTLNQAYERAMLTPQDQGWLQAYEVAIHLDMDDLTFARRWADQVAFSSEDNLAYTPVEQYVIYGRVLIALDHLEQADRWLAHLARFTEERRLHRPRLSTHLQQALIAEAKGDRSAARAHLEAAVQIAAPEGLIRPFLDEDAEVLELLPAARHIAPGFVEQVLEAGGLDAQRRRTDAQPLDEPLSERELEVLTLIADGLANSEIAARLYITVGTVKRHINHIYGKLGVGSRTQAVARARELRLLS